MKFSVGRISGFNWVCVCQYEFERRAAILMIMNEAFGSQKKLLRHHNPEDQFTN